MSRFNDLASSTSSVGDLDLSSRRLIGIAEEYYVVRGGATRAGWRVEMFKLEESSRRI